MTMKVLKLLITFSFTLKPTLSAKPLSLQIFLGACLNKINVRVTDGQRPHER